MSFTVEWKLSSPAKASIGSLDFERWEDALATWKALKREPACTEAIIKQGGFEVRLWRPVRRV